MKRFLSILLACMMVFSVTSFAAPAAVGTVESAVEVFENDTAASS